MYNPFIEQFSSLTNVITVSFRETMCRTGTFVLMEIRIFYDAQVLSLNSMAQFETSVRKNGKYYINLHTNVIILL